MPRLIFDRTVGTYLMARIMAAIGIWIHNVVAAIVVWESTRSALLVGSVSVAQFGPQIFLAPYMGAVADRGSRRRQAATGHVTAAVGSGALALWILGQGGGGANGAWPVIGAAFIVGVGFAVGAPAAQALVPLLGRESELPSLVVLISTPGSIGRTVGPALGAVVLLMFGPAASFGIASATMILLALVVVRIRLRLAPRDPTQQSSVTDGFRYLRHDVDTFLLLLGVAGVGFGVDPIITLSPSVADQLGGGSRLVAQIASAFGVGALLVVPFYGVLRRHFGHEPMGYLGLVIMSLSMVLLAMSGTRFIAVATSLLAGIGMMSAITSLSVQIQERVREQYRGRIMALWIVAFLGSRPIAASLNGAITDTWSAGVALLFVAALLVCASYLVRRVSVAH